MKKIYVFLCLAGFLFYEDVAAQQDPQYTQYMYNMNVVNPAYAGSKESLSIGILGRQQWSGFDGAPETFTFSAHSPIGEKTGLGLSAISDKYGPVNETNIYADFSYTLNLGSATKLAFGIKAGATFHDVGLIGLELQNSTDIAFSENTNETFANIGAGFFLYSDKYYVGFSVPNFIKSTHLTVDGTEIGSEVNHFFATAGYVFQLSPNTKFKPSTLVKTAFGAPVSFDVNANFLFYDRFEIGASYRLDDAVSGLVNFRITDWVQAGFAYDHVLSDINEQASASYEAFLIFDIFFNQKVYRSPRFF
ncbi:MAG TPA: type IX secretion system membrane protein PorP/SprF [Salinimicrobium sp.]|nr:type IX secretion system membrane protein PorP/SprF [Salinimicrobium sp.]